VGASTIDLHRRSAREALPALRANVDTTHGIQQSERALTVAGQPGREQRINAGQLAYVFRMVFIGNRLYSISVSGTALQVDQADAILFLDSFAITQ